MTAKNPPVDIRRMVDAELQPGEHITWMGQPLPGRYARGAIFLVLFGIPWTAFALFWTVAAAWGVSKSHGPGVFALFPLFGVPFILVGVGLLSSPFWMRRAALRTAYVITNRRAIVFAGGWRGSSIRSFTPQRLTDIRRQQNNDGSGDLIFAQDWSRDSDGDRRARNVGFLAIPEVKNVEDRIRALVAGDSENAPPLPPPMGQEQA